MSINFFVLVNIVVQFYLILPLILISVKSINRVKSIDFGYSSLYNAKYREKMQVTCRRYINSDPRAGDRSWSNNTYGDKFFFGDSPTTFVAFVFLFPFILLLTSSVNSEYLPTRVQPNTVLFNNK